MLFISLPGCFHAPQAKHRTGAKAISSLNSVLGHQLCEPLLIDHAHGTPVGWNSRFEPYFLNLASCSTSRKSSQGGKGTNLTKKVISQMLTNTNETMPACFLHLQLVLFVLPPCLFLVHYFSRTISLFPCQPFHPPLPFFLCVMNFFSTFSSSLEPNRMWKRCFLLPRSKLFFLLLLELSVLVHCGQTPPIYN